MSGFQSSSLALFSTFPPPSFWPQKLPGETLKQTYNVTPQVSAPASIQALTAQIAPSGSGELEPTAFSLSGSTLSLTLEGGQPSRVYTILFSATLSDGEVIQWTILQPVAQILAGDKPQAPMSWEFGTPITCVLPTSLNFSQLRNSAFIL
jgi:hypothetical protein